MCLLRRHAPAFFPFQKASVSYTHLDVYKRQSKYIALVIDTLNHDASISSILDPSERIQNVVEKYKKGEAID